MKTDELLNGLVSQIVHLNRSSEITSDKDLKVIEAKQKLAQINESMEAIESSIAQQVLSDPTLTNEGRRQNALRDAKNKDLSWIGLSKELRSASHDLAIANQGLKQASEARASLEIHSRNLQRAAELLAADLHEQAASKRQQASINFLQGERKKS